MNPIPVRPFDNQMPQMQAVAARASATRRRYRHGPSAGQAWGDAGKGCCSEEPEQGWPTWFCLL